jgi:adenosine deaminase
VNACGAGPTREEALRIPKVSLHCHLLGSVSATTAIDLARAHNIPVPEGVDVHNFYDIAAYEDLGQFLAVYDRIGQSMQSRDDVYRVTYESLTSLGAAHTVWFREIAVSPQAIPLPYREMLAGIRDGMQDAKQDSGIDSRIIMAINRELGTAQAIEVVQQIIEHRVDEVVGVGLDYAEASGPPAMFTAAFDLAHRAGLGCTAHSESGPPHNVEIMLDQLHCTRIDHGYHVVGDERITRRCAEEQILFTATPVSSDIGRYSGSGDGSHRRIKQMIERDLKICVDSDDPAMFGTDPTNDYYVIGRALNYRMPQLLQFTANAIDGCWLDETGKRTLHARLAAWAEDQTSNRSTSR